MRWLSIVFCVLFAACQLKAQSSFEEKFNSLKKVTIDTGVVMFIDEPEVFTLSEPTHIIIYALPNGNTTAQTFGKKTNLTDDWHFDIQHIGAQLAFIRNTDKLANYVVVYLENDLKSWPAWNRKYQNSEQVIGNIVEDLLNRYKTLQPKITLTGHSGGGSFIFAYINTQKQIPSYIERIGFLDATYGYDTDKHVAKLKTWLQTKNKSLQVIAYNDSVVVYNNKPLVSPTGGTWYRSQLMAKDLQHDFKLKKSTLTDRLNWTNRQGSIDFSLIKNPEAKIFHTLLVERNGFIHLVFNGTPFQDTAYEFWAERAYKDFILK